MMTETTEQIIEAKTPQTAPLPGGGVGIHLPGGELVNPVHVSVKSLVRVGSPAFEAIMQWLTDERERESARLAAADEALQESRRQIVADAEARAAATEALREKEPWKF